jgi:biofilm PGA synthesis N-glycosyltransferase PgaC
MNPPDSEKWSLLLNWVGPWDAWLIVLILEIPLYGVILFGVFLYLRRQKEISYLHQGHPLHLTCLVTCYAEGDEAALAIRTLVEQDYEGRISIVAMVDGAEQNNKTYMALRRYAAELEKHPWRSRRELRILPKWMRGGRVSSLNLGLQHVEGQVVLACDADTMMDNDAIRKALSHFNDPHVVAVSGNLRVLNWNHSIWTRLQAVEYAFSISLTRTGLSEFNAVNNISGAFGFFRTSLVKHIGGWNNGSAEDLDITIRIKQYFRRNPKMKIRFEPFCIAHTEAPVTFKNFLKQRERWDGDLAYLYFRKLWRSFTPKLVGWTNWISAAWLGLIHQVALPILISFGICWFMATDPVVFAKVLFMAYLGYTLLTALLFGVYYIWFSENQKRDRHLWWVIPLFFPFSMVYRVWSGISILLELTIKAHLDSSMAPYWVLRKAKY